MMYNSPYVIAMVGVTGHETFDNKFTLENFWVLVGLGISIICPYCAFLEDRFSFATSTITKLVGFKLQWNKCSITSWDSELHDFVPCCTKGLSPQLRIFCEFMGFFL
jgi:hypothetical protein